MLLYLKLRAREGSSWGFYKQSEINTDLLLLYLYYFLADVFKRSSRLFCYLCLHWFTDDQQLSTTGTGVGNIFVEITPSQLVWDNFVTILCTG